jgi:hypothetical protein
MTHCCKFDSNLSNFTNNFDNNLNSGNFPQLSFTTVGEGGIIFWNIDITLDDDNLWKFVF